MNTYMIGSTVRLKLAFTQNGSAATPATTTLQVRLPDGTSVSPSLLSDGNGAFHADYTPTLPGAYAWYATGSGFPGLLAADAIAAESTFFVSTSRTLTP